MESVEELNSLLEVVVDELDLFRMEEFFVNELTDRSFEELILELAEYSLIEFLISWKTFVRIIIITYLFSYSKRLPS